MTDGRGRPKPAGDLPAWLAGVAPRAAAGQAVVALVCDRKMRDLNRRFRGIDRVTDVLSFPADPADPADPAADPADPAGPADPTDPADPAADPADPAGPADPTDPGGSDEPGAPGTGTAAGGARWLGDIVIATGRAARQARTAGLTETEERRRLALHGLLHLLGYDHERDDGRMRRLERRLRRRGGLPVDDS